MDKYQARKELHKDRLQEEVIKAIKTTMIGALASVEEKFGSIWGFKSERPLTDDEQYFSDLFQEVRKEILDKGNTQIKKVKSIIDPYSVDYVGYTINIALPRRKEENNEC